MKIKDGYIKVESYDGFVVTTVGDENKNNKIMLTLNGTASEIWDMLKEGKSADEITAALSEKYGITKEKAQDGVDKIIDSLKKEGILTE